MAAGPRTEGSSPSRRRPVAEKDAEEHAHSASSLVAEVTASTASGSGHDATEVAIPGEASEVCGVQACGEALQKLPLQHAWCLWVLQYSLSTKDNWQNSQMNVHAYDTVEDFWRAFNNINSPSRLGNIDFSVFKKDIAPAWEDETCRQGGRWLAKLDKLRPEDFDELWLNVILTMIGEGFGEPGLCVCGAVVSSRAKNSKMALWLSEKSEEKAVPIGQAFHQILQEAGFSGEIIFEEFQTQSKAFSIGKQEAKETKDPKETSTAVS